MNHSTVLPPAALSVALGLLLASGHAGAQSTSSPPAPLSQAQLSQLVQQQAVQIPERGGRLAEDFIARGTLVRPLKTTQREERGFYLLVPKEVPLSKAGELFRDWIVAEAKG